MLLLLRLLGLPVKVPLVRPKSQEVRHPGCVLRAFKRARLEGRRRPCPLTLYGRPELMEHRNTRVRGRKGPGRPADPPTRPLLPRERPARGALSSFEDRNESPNEPIVLPRKRKIPRRSWGGRGHPVGPEYTQSAITQARPFRAATQVRRSGRPSRSSPRAVIASAAPKAAA